MRFIPKALLLALIAGENNYQKGELNACLFILYHYTLIIETDEGGGVIMQTIKVTCLMAFSRPIKRILNPKLPWFKEGETYEVHSSGGMHPDYWLSISGHTSQTWDVWKAPSGLYYVLKVHCQPWDGVHAILKED